MTKSQVLSKSSPKKGYKEYFKMRLPIYSAQYPSENESKITNLIIAQFEKYTSEQHLKIIRGQMQLQPLNLDGSAKKKKPTPNDTQLADSGNKSSKPSSMKEMKHQSQFKQIEQSYSSQIMQTPRSSRQIMKAPKTKTDNKKEYLKFYDFYFDKLHKQHPKWVANQITSIIKLLWRKKKAQHSQRKSSMNSNKTMRKMSGYQAFQNQFKKSQVPNIVMRQNWNKLPKEGKMYWEKIGNHSAKKSMNQPSIIRLKNNMMQPSNQKMQAEMPKMSLSFMSKKM